MTRPEYAAIKSISAIFQLKKKKKKLGNILNQPLIQLLISMHYAFLGVTCRK